jgi:transcriptional regulator with XRE-family HTH domain
MTIARLAAASGLSEDYMNKLELGRYMPSADTLVAIAEALDVGVGELFLTDRKRTEKSEALNDLHAQVLQYDAVQIRYLIGVIDRVMQYPRRRG